MLPPLAVYLHWPFCRKKCPYCDFNSHVRGEIDQAAWRQALLVELDTMAARLAGHRVSSIFFGGGTPSLMPPATVGALIDRVRCHFSVSDDLEITLEANPTSSEAAKFRDFHTAGVNRLSIGVQSLDVAALAFLGREHDVEQALGAVACAREIFPRCSFDLIYALPGQSLGAWEAELARALSFAPDHLSLYQLTVEEETPFARWHAVGGFTLPAEDDAALLYETTRQRCAEAGLNAYEISNFAAPGKECRHNLSYWKGDPYLGIGPGAHGRLQGDDGWIATQTLKSPERWLSAVGKNGHGIEQEEMLSPLQRGEELVLTGLRLADGIDREDFAGKAGIGLDAVIPAERQRFYAEKGLLDLTPGRLAATEAGQRVLNSLLGALLAA